ncbi:MAG: hypothetical protein K2P22_11350 [Lachnospiraceae bacterium]|nr:hypothetical protein [Lachnospiraceae bacterium]
MADKTVGALAAVTEAAIGSLPGIADLYDDTLLPVEQQGEARHMTGRQWKRYAQASVSHYVDGAQEAAEAAGRSAAEAAESARAAAGSAHDAAGSAQSAKEYSGKPPIIQDGRWWTWNAALQQYVDTGEAARGNLMYATFWLNPETGELYMITDREYTGPAFRLVDGELEVVLQHG